MSSNEVEYHLHYSNGAKPYVRVVPHDRWPGLWRMIWPDGRMSDGATLERCKSVAVEIAARAPQLGARAARFSTR